jgi:hypothetical protein
VANPSKALGLCAATPGPTQDSQEGGPHERCGRGGSDLMASRKNSMCGGRRGSEAGSFSYRGARGTLGTRFDPLPVTGSKKGGPNHQLAELSDVMLRGGWRRRS